MTLKDLSKAWDTAAGRALAAWPGPLGVDGEQLSTAAGLQVRTGLSAGGPWGVTDYCTSACSSGGIQCTYSPCG